MPEKNRKRKSEDLLAMIRRGQPMSTGQQLRLTLMLSVPAVLAQLSSILMQYIDAAMVGSLGAAPAASIGLVSTTTWLFSGTCTAVSTGFSVQVAHVVGAGDMARARSVLRQAFVSVGIFGLLWGGLGMALSSPLPYWIGGEPEICRDASMYFLIYAAFLPVFQVYVLSGGMLRCSGDMRIPSLLSILMCVLDVVFNFFLIFPTRDLNILGRSVTVPGAGWGVEGAALGTGLAELVTASLMLYFLLARSESLRLTGRDRTSGEVQEESRSFIPTAPVLRMAARISFPMAVEHIVLCGAQIMTTAIVAPLGIFAIAANSFAVTAESLCYMPGYGIADAATTLVGQSYGAGRKYLTRRFACITVFSGMAVMGVMGLLMYVGAPLIMGSMTSDGQIMDLGVEALRIEAFAEPMFAASIVAYSVFVGMGKTLTPCLMNLGSIWAVRLPLAALLAPSAGLRGVWTAMCIELCFRGCIFLLRLWHTFRHRKSHS